MMAEINKQWKYEIDREWFEEVVRDALKLDIIEQRIRENLAQHIDNDSQIAFEFGEESFGVILHTAEECITVKSVDACELLRAEIEGYQDRKGDYILPKRRLEHWRQFVALVNEIDSKCHVEA